MRYVYYMDYIYILEQNTKHKTQNKLKLNVYTIIIYDVVQENFIRF